MDTNFNLQDEIELARQTEREFRMRAPRTAESVERRTNSRFLRHLFIPAVLFIVGIIAGTAMAQHNTAAPADTIPPCSMYAFTSTPDLGGARDDACFTENPDGGFTISTGAGVETAGY